MPRDSTAARKAWDTRRANRAPSRSRQERRFHKAHSRLRQLEKRYSSPEADLHFEKLARGDADLLPALAELCAEGLSLVESNHAWFASHSLYDDGMFWYDLFLTVSAASLRVGGDHAQAYIPVPLVEQIAVCLIKISPYADGGDIATRNYEALGNTLLVFGEAISLSRVRRLAGPMAPATKRFVKMTKDRVGEVLREREAAGAAREKEGSKLERTESRVRVQGESMIKKQMRRVVIGDIHGELSGLKDILRHAGLIDRRARWAPRDTILIQTGDVIDRGPHSRGAVSLLRALQQEAPNMGSQVVRCCGNHELMLLQECYDFADFSGPEALADEFREEIARGLLQAAYTDGVRLYTHAGVRTRVHDLLAQEMGGPPRSGPAHLKALAAHINTIFQAAVAENRCETANHCLFWIERARGGRDAVGGVFWCDFPALAGSEGASVIPQVFGHTPSRKSGFSLARGLRLINVDAGMCKVFGGHRVYLEITEDGTTIQHSKHGSVWRATRLGQEDFVQ